jgi:hypothetical protein
MMAGRSTCSNGSFTLPADPTLSSRCFSSCTGTADQSIISGLATCLGGVPACTSGNENVALGGFQACASDAVPGLSSGCQAAIAGGPPIGGGTGGGVPVGGGTGGGVPVGGGAGGGVPVGGGAGGAARPSTLCRSTRHQPSTQDHHGPRQHASDPTDLLHSSSGGLTPLRGSRSATVGNTAVLSARCCAGVPELPRAASTMPALA